jgi:hypothetical protein
MSKASQKNVTHQHRPQGLHLQAPTIERVFKPVVPIAPSVASGAVFSGNTAPYEPPVTPPAVNEPVVWIVQGGAPEIAGSSIMGGGNITPARASATRGILNDGWVEFAVSGSGTQRIGYLGLHSSMEINPGVWLYGIEAPNPGGNFAAVEGEAVNQPLTGYEFPPTQTVRMWLHNGVIEWWVSGILYYTSLNPPPPGPLFVMAYLTANSGSGFLGVSLSGNIVTV